MNNWTLVDAEKINQKYPLSFEIPCQISKALIGVGDYVKVIFKYRKGRWGCYHAERMWLKVTDTFGEQYMGDLKCHPIEGHILSFNDEVVFRKKHIISIEYMK